MRARRREINIFNMSLLDILCGALGAFCCMLLVALPYYRPAQNAAQVQEQRARTEQLMREIEKLKEKLSDPSAAEDLEELLRQLQAQIQALQGQVNQLTGENEQLRADKQQLSVQNQQLRGEHEQLNEENRQLKARSPFVVFVQSDVQQDLDLYLDDVTAATSKGEKNPPFDPGREHHATFWPGDLSVYAPGRGVSTWMVRDTPAGSRFKIYAKVQPLSVFTAPAHVDGIVMGSGFSTIPLPKITLTTSRSWALIGILSCAEPGKVTFVEATEAERDAEWRALGKSTVSPTVTGTPGTSATPTERERLQRERERLRREAEENRRQQSPAPAPDGATTTSPNSLEQRRAEMEKLRREQPQPSPVPTP
jgi:predicted metal-dependent enzyme (double-stranded beta helix superfamily)